MFWLRSQVGNYIMFSKNTLWKFEGMHLRMPTGAPGSTWQIRCRWCRWTFLWPQGCFLRSTTEINPEATSFFIYVKDMESCVPCKVILYADDYALLVSDQHIQSIGKVLEDNLLSLSIWLIANKLSLKSSHIIYMIISLCCSHVLIL